jgi:outer membrane protein OmpA-like peptidoglycan-associated protein
MRRILKTQAMAAALVVGAGSIVAGCGSVSTLAVGRQIATTPHCTDFFFSVYFAPASDTVSKQARTIIQDAGSHAKGCKVAAVDVVGLSDERGMSDANLNLSHRRADHVAAALAETGLPAPTFKLSALEEAGALATVGGKPMRRRVDITVRFAP